MNKGIKIFLATLIALLAAILIPLCTYFIITSGTKLEPDKLVDYTKTITILDENGNKIESASSVTGQKSVSISNLNKDTVNAFIASEDRNFYKHNGLNYKRMLKAGLKNLTSMSFKEGASTISQQLIKNTHLNSDKTIARKLKEIRLTKKLEKKYSKDSILEMYLNTIYFGHNCYGLEKAANYYFDCTAEELTLEQSATVVGLLISPNNYSPFNHPDKCLTRRNVVLKNMFDCGYIGKEQYEQTKNKPLGTVKNNRTENCCDYVHAVFDELDGLDLGYFTDYSEFTIKTYMRPEAQNKIEQTEFENDGAIFIRSNDGRVLAYRSTINNSKRQIGSTAKPIFVYGPAIDQGKVHLITKICDEKVNFNGYKPENYDKSYHGYVTVEESIKQSYNVPAVKTLNTLNLGDVQAYARKMNLNISEDDKNLALALGAMKEGLTLKELCDAYSTFQGGGNFTKSAFINEITDKIGKTVYKNANTAERVFTEGTASLINQALINTVNSGTARKLKNVNVEIACKTGTCGNTEGNTDAYAVCYTADLCLGVWLGDKDNKRCAVTGGTDCCNIAKEIFGTLYPTPSNKKIEVDRGTSIVEIDNEEYQQSQKIIVCDDRSPKLNRLKVKFNNNYLPTEKSVKFTNPTIKTPNFIVDNNNICIELCQTKYYQYLIKRKNQDEIKEIYRGGWTSKIFDTLPDGEYIYEVIPYYVYDGVEYVGKSVELPKVKINTTDTETKLPDIVSKDWFNQ